ncbi:hypothetical protein DICVIV_08520 [Dictyocaulus viviparus]|uniref:Uncharacterized protein n=1 Tax=Dictyocaulus viviparus TaxID=29172 RepID=A0A0D8XST6_DICVI|nr:hypothetical protein DICVIV_08520 [Dictyocaulus viviparus]
MHDAGLPKVRSRVQDISNGDLKMGFSGRLVYSGDKIKSIQRNFNMFDKTGDGATSYLLFQLRIEKLNSAAQTISDYIRKMRLMWKYSRCVPIIETANLYGSDSVLDQSVAFYVYINIYKKWKFYYQSIQNNLNLRDVLDPACIVL